MTFLKQPRESEPVSSPHVETIRAVAAAFDARDADAYVSYMTEDVVASPPGFLIGRRELHGHDELRAAFAEGMAALALGDGRTITVGHRRYFLDRLDRTKVLSVSKMTVFPKGGQDTFGTENTLLFTLTGDSKVSRLESWANEAEGIAQLKEPVAVDG
jgi:hypothetical protein